MISILRGLLFRVEGGIIYVPSWRDDVRCMNDIAEEIIRIWGYNEIKSTSFRSGVKTGEYTPRKAYSLRLNNLLCSLGCWETCNFRETITVMQKIRRSMKPHLSICPERINHFSRQSGFRQLLLFTAETSIR